MTDRALRILQVNTSNTMGGAARVAADLGRGYRSRGHTAWMAVGHKDGDDPDVFQLPNDPPAGRIVRSITKAVEFQLGIEDFRFPGAHRILDLTPRSPDVVHCHNLHGGYFDLRALAPLSEQLPVVLTLHDAWLLSGHCAHSMSCQRWMTGCGACPDLTLYPAVRRDATAFNWKRKRSIYERSGLVVATPSAWLMRKVEQSMLMPAIVDARVVPNGVDLSTFAPGDQASARAELGIPTESDVILFAAQAPRGNIWKDYDTLRAAVDLAAERLPERNVLFVALGDDGPSERLGRAQMTCVPYQPDPATVARYYRASDVYVHAARADTFPSSVIEALACGIPTVATAVGGIPEQVDDGETGFLVPHGDPGALASRLVLLLTDATLRKRMGAQAAVAGHRRFDLARQVDTYLEWYGELARSRSAPHGRLA